MSLEHLRIPVEQPDAPPITVGLTVRGNALLQADGGNIEIDPAAWQELCEAVTLALAAGRQLNRRQRRTNEVGDRPNRGAVRRGEGSG